VFAATKKEARSRVALARAVLRDERGLKPRDYVHAIDYGIE
jgi:hypothetical protein